MKEAAPSPSPRPTARIPALLVPAVLLAFVAGRCLVPMDETDLFYNLRLGEIILGTGKVPLTNLLSFTNPDVPDPNLAWLFQIVLALCHRAGGIAATVWLKTAFVVATFGLLYRVCLRRGAHPALAALALGLAAWAAEPRFVERPHLVTFLGLAALLLAIERAEAGRPGWLYGLVPLGLLWVNGNSCFFLAPSVLLVYAAGAWAEGARRTAGRAALVAAALVPLILATPSGAGALGYIANHFRMPTLRPLQEYRTAEWPLDGPFFFLVAAVAGAAAVAIAPGAASRAARMQLRHLFPLLALGALGARRIRFVAEFALLAGPHVAVHATRLARHLRQRRPSLARLGGPGTGAAVALLALLTVLPRLRGDRFNLGIEPGLVPFADIAWVNSHGLRDRLYNDLEVGSYLAWEGWPRHRVFQDPRINGYPAAWHARLRRRDLTRAEWQAFLDGHGVTAAVISFPDENPRAALFDPGRWALVHRSRESLVFARRGPDHRAVIAEHEQPLTFHYDENEGATAALINQAPPDSPVPACEWQRRVGQALVELNEPAAAARAFDQALAAPSDCLSPRQREAARLQAAALALGAGAPERAVALLEGLSAPAALVNRGFALLKLERPADALATLDQALARAPDDAEATFGRGLALRRLGRTRESEATLHDFITRFPGHFAVPEAKRVLGPRFGDAQ
jgi:tetratricopeptide (TPR) repeat protein